MRMTSSQGNNSPFDQRLTECLFLMIREQNSQKETLDKLITELVHFRQNVLGDLQRLQASVDSIDRKVASGRNCVCGADTPESVQPVGGAKHKRSFKPVQKCPEDNDEETNPNINTRREEKHADKPSLAGIPYDGRQDRRQPPPESPVPIKSDPPRNVPKPVARSCSKVSRNSKTEVYNFHKEPLPHKALITPQPQESDFINLMKSLCLEVNRTTIAAITSVAEHLSGNSLGSRPAALNTILIVDTSESMRGQPFETAKRFVHKMIDDIDISAGEYGLEEYIAVIQCGESVSIQQPFTNDFLQIRNTIDRLQVGGRTPLMTSLVLALCYLELQSECVKMSEHVIMPRLIVMSDFDATFDTHPFSGRDSDQSSERIKVQREMFKLGLTFKNRGYTMVCVPIGESNDAVSNEFASKSDGELVKPNSVQDVGCYYRYQMLIGRALEDYDEGCKHNQELDVYNLVQTAMTEAGLGKSHTEGLMSLLDKILNKVDDIDSDDNMPAQGQAQERSEGADKRNKHGEPPDLPVWQPTRNIENIGFEEVSGMPSIGSRIRRGKDWKWGNDGNGGPGTVVGHKQKGIAYILWDSGEVGCYRHGHEGKYDIVKTNEPRYVEPGGIEIGCCVTRGADWERGEEDGGPGTVGVVVRKMRERYVQVRWPSRVIEDYAFGADNKWELEVTLSSHRSGGSNTPVGSGQGDYPQPTMGNTDNKDLKAWWSWRDKFNQWRPFSESGVERLELKYNSKGIPQHCLVEYKDKLAKVNMAKNNCEIMGQMYPVKREMLKPEEIENLKLIETFLQPLE